MHRRLLLLVSLTGLLAIFGACSSSGGTGASTTVTTATNDSVVAPSGTIDPSQGWRPWWIVDGKVTPGDVRPPSGGNDPEAAINVLIAGPSPTESAFGAGNGLISPKGAIVLNSLTVDADGIAHIDFNRNFETADTRPQTAQVVYTLTQFPQIKKVQFLIDGQPNGATGVPPVDRSDLRFPATT